MRRLGWHHSGVMDVSSRPARPRPPLWLLALATGGAILLAVVATSRWSTPSDEHAYWLAGYNVLTGQPIYELARRGPVEPYAYHYPPPFAQIMAPIAAIVPADLWTALWTALLLGCLYWLAGRNLLFALASIAVLPVAVELWFRNVHLPLAVLTVLGLRRWPVLLGIAALVKLSPGLGLLYLAAKGRFRAAALGASAALAIAAASYAIGPALWAEFIDVTVGRGPLDVSGFVPIPYAFRFATGTAIVLLAARLRPPWDDGLAIIGVTVALPTLWLTALSFLLAVLPVVGLGTSMGRPDPRTWTAPPPSRR